MDSGGLGNSGPNLPSEDAWRTQAGLLQLLSMLGEEADLQSDVEDEWESMDEDEDENEDEGEEGN